MFTLFRPPALIMMVESGISRTIELNVCQQKIVWKTHDHLHETRKEMLGPQAVLAVGLASSWVVLTSVVNLNAAQEVS